MCQALLRSVSVHIIFKVITTTALEKFLYFLYIIKYFKCLFNLTLMEYLKVHMLAIGLLVPDAVVCSRNSETAPSQLEGNCSSGTGADA